jgi:hypothetical protein
MRFPYPYSHSACRYSQAPAFAVKIVTDYLCKKLARGITRGCYDRLELLDARDHGIVPVQDDLVIESFDDRFNGIIIDKYHGIFIDVSFHPDLRPPPVTVEIGALPLVMEKPMTCIKMDILVNPGFHR